MAALRFSVYFFLFMSVMTGLVHAACLGHFDRAWGAARLNADSVGADCGKAVLVLTVRDASGNALWTNAYRTADLMTFQNLPKLSSQTMSEQLRSWIAPDKRLSSSASLPDWPQSSSDGTLPPNAEFPFRVAEGLDRETYLKLRKARLPLACFVTGMESQTCLVLDGDAVTNVGTQSFPG